MLRYFVNTIHSLYPEHVRLEMTPQRLLGPLTPPSNGVNKYVAVNVVHQGRETAHSRHPPSVASAQSDFNLTIRVSRLR